MTANSDLSDDDYRTLASFRRALRTFAHFSEGAAEDGGLTPQQHQALLAIRASGGMTIGDLAESLLLRPHSATGLVDRLVKRGLAVRQGAQGDRRQVELSLTGEAETLLLTLSAAHREELRRLRPLLMDLLGRL